MENKSNFEGYQIMKKEVNFLQWPMEDNITFSHFDRQEECNNFNDLEEMKVEGIDIKEEMEEHWDFESMGKYEYMYHQLGKQESSNDENLFLGFITENENDMKSHIVENLEISSKLNKLNSDFKKQAYEENSNDENLFLGFIRESDNDMKSHIVENLEVSSKLNKLNSDFKKQAYEKNSLMLMDVPSLGPIKKHRRINCGECDGCLKPDCRVCVYCKDKYKKINRLKQKCVQRKCFKFKLCSAATCYLCGSKYQSDSPPSIEDESEIMYDLMECSLCFRIAHVYCQEKLCNGREGKILTTKCNLWQCPECVPFLMDDFGSMEKKDTSLSRIAQCSQGAQEEMKSNKFNSKRQKKEDKYSKVKTRKPHFEISLGISFKDFKSITGRRPWNGYTVFMAMSSKMLNKQGKSKDSLPFVEAKGLEWQQLPERKKMVFREGAKKINRLLLKNAKNLLKMKKTTK